MTQSPLARYMAEQNARPVHTTRRRTLRSDLRDLREWLAGRDLMVSNCHQAPVDADSILNDGSAEAPYCEACRKPCTPVWPAAGTVLRLRWRSLWQWSWQHVFPGWLFVLMAVCGLIILEINKATALLNAAARCVGQ